VQVHHRELIDYHESLKSTGQSIIKHISPGMHKKIPVILLTAIADYVTTTTYTHRDVLDSDAEVYIPKPVQ
jgi:response regulator RpfG family c-di-GMP phosphodiesterase